MWEVAERLTPRVLPAALLTAVALALLAPFASAASVECVRNFDDAKGGKRLKPPIALAPAAGTAQRQLNFGTNRGEKVMRRLVLTASKPLPKQLRPEQIAFEALLSRSGESLESTDFADPTFTMPKISADRRTVVFSACFDGSGISAGKYVGAINVSGPVGLGAASINVTVNAKDSELFTFGLVAAILIAFVLLLVKDAAAALPDKDGKWRQAWLVPLGDPRWWVMTLAALGAAFGSLYTVYEADPSWGATGLGSVWALIGSGFAAIGGQSVLTSLRQK